MQVTDMESYNTERTFLVGCHIFCDFFTDSFQLHKNQGLYPHFKAYDAKDLALEYDFLFRGTDGDIYIPLWASACFDQGRILWDQETLQVIEEYYSLGYQPVIIDGNPPDYIGTQMDFLAYLTAAILFEAEGSDGQAALRARREAFIHRHLMPTVKAFSAALKGCRPDGPFAAFNRQLQSFVACGETIYAQPFVNGAAKFENRYSDIAAGGLKAAIKIGDKRRIRSAGINNCGGKCIICPEVQEGCLLNITTDDAANAPQIKACVRGRGYRHTFLSSERLRYPMKRIGERGSGRFERISWEEAVTAIAANWKRIKKDYGVGSRYVHYATGVTGVMRPNALAKRLLCLDGGYLDYYNSYSSACARYVTPYIYGIADSGNSPQDMLNTKLLILWGHNPAETIFGSERNHYLMELKQKGVRIIVIDPRYSQSMAAYADQWIPLKPSTDSALADAMAYTIWSENLQNQDFMDTYCIGFDEAHMPEGIPWGESYHTYLFGLKDGIPKTAAWAEAITGVPQATITALAREYAGAKPACLLPGLGLQRTRNGEQTIRSTALLPCLTGNVGISGGGAGGVCGAIEHHNPILPDTPENPFKGQIPVFLWSQAIVRGTAFEERQDGLKGVKQLDTNIKMLLNLAGNTLLNQHSDINETMEILKDESKCEFILVSDIFMTPSARFADILLPGTSVFEGNNIVAPWSGGSYVLRNNQAIEPLFDCRFEWEWLKELAKKLDLYDDFIGISPDIEVWLEQIYEDLREKEPELPGYDEFCEKGGCQYRNEIRYIAFREQIADFENHPFATPSGKIEIFSKALYEMDMPEEIPGIPRYVPCIEGPEDPLTREYPLQLIGWHTRRRCHSIHDNNPWLEEVDPPGLWIHPEDGEKRGIKNGDYVEVYNARGRLLVPAVVTRRIMPGVVALSQGGWYKPDKTGRDTRGSINVLTATKHPSPLAKGNPQHTNLVEVKKA